MICGLALLGAAAFCFNNQNSIVRARTEQQSRLNDKKEFDRLVAENAQIDNLKAANESVQKLRLENQDLPRLRNEVRLLRKQTADAAKLIADNQRLTNALNKRGDSAASLPADYVTRDALADVGLSTPEATIQTFFHAMSKGDLNRLNQCALIDRPNSISKENEEQQAKQLQEQFAQFPGFRVAEKEFISADEVTIGIQSTPGGISAPIKLKLVDGEWKMNMK
jgi:hypothetical protein